MMNILIIFLTQYFWKKIDLVVKIFQLLLSIFFSSMNLKTIW
jgi:hypothetical protein